MDADPKEQSGKEPPSSGSGDDSIAAYGKQLRASLEAELDELYNESFRIDTTLPPPLSLPLESARSIPLSVTAPIPDMDIREDPSDSATDADKGNVINNGNSNADTTEIDTIDTTEIYTKTVSSPVPVLIHLDPLPSTLSSIRSRATIPSGTNHHLRVSALSSFSVESATASSSSSSSMPLTDQHGSMAQPQAVVSTFLHRYSPHDADTDSPATATITSTTTTTTTVITTTAAENNNTTHHDHAITGHPSSAMAGEKGFSFLPTAESTNTDHDHDSFTVVSIPSRPRNTDDTDTDIDTSATNVVIRHSVFSHGNGDRRVGEDGGWNSSRISVIYNGESGRFPIVHITDMSATSDASIDDANNTNNGDHHDDEEDDDDDPSARLVVYPQPPRQHQAGPPPQSTRFLGSDRHGTILSTTTTLKTLKSTISSPIDSPTPTQTTTLATPRPTDTSTICTHDTFVGSFSVAFSEGVTDDRLSVDSDAPPVPPIPSDAATVDSSASVRQRHVLVVDALRGRAEHQDQQDQQDQQQQHHQHGYRYSVGNRNLVVPMPIKLAHHQGESDADTAAQGQSQPPRMRPSSLLLDTHRLSNADGSYNSYNLNTNQPSNQQHLKQPSPLLPLPPSAMMHPGALAMPWNHHYHAQTQLSPSSSSSSPTMLSTPSSSTPPPPPLPPPSTQMYNMQQSAHLRQPWMHSGYASRVQQPFHQPQSQRSVQPISVQQQYQRQHGPLMQKSLTSALSSSLSVPSSVSPTPPAPISSSSGSSSTNYNIPLGVLYRSKPAVTDHQQNNLHRHNAVGHRRVEVGRMSEGLRAGPVVPIRSICRVDDINNNRGHLVPATNNSNGETSTPKELFGKIDDDGKDTKSTEPIHGHRATPWINLNSLAKPSTWQKKSARTDKLTKRKWLCLTIECWIIIGAISIVFVSLAIAGTLFWPRMPSFSVVSTSWGSASSSSLSSSSSSSQQRIIMQTAPLANTSTIPGLSKTVYSDGSIGLTTTLNATVKITNPNRFTLKLRDIALTAGLKIDADIINGIVLFRNTTSKRYTGRAIHVEPNDDDNMQIPHFATTIQRDGNAVSLPPLQSMTYTMVVNVHYVMGKDTALDQDAGLAQLCYGCRLITAQGEHIFKVPQKTALPSRSISRADTTASSRPVLTAMYRTIMYNKWLAFVGHRPEFIGSFQFTCPTDLENSLRFTFKNDF